MTTTTPVRTRVGGLLRATHAAPTAMVTGMSVALLAGARAPLWVLVLGGAAVLTGQLSVGWSNDWIDAHRDHAAGRTDKPVVGGAVSPAALRSGALLAAGACVVVSLAAGVIGGSVPAGLAHVVAVASAWAYNAGLKATVWSWAPYALSFGLLVVFLVGSLPGPEVAPAWLVLGAALLGTGAHVANVLPDLEDDHLTGVRGLPHRLGRRVSAVLAPVVLLAAVGVLVLGPGGTPARWSGVLAVVAGALAVAAGAVGARAPRSRLPFTLSMLVAAVCVVLVVAAGPSLG